MTDSTTDLPVVVIGAGPIGLAAAADLRTQGLPFLVLEAGDTAGAAVRQWHDVRLFSPWSELVDPRAAALLAPTGWQRPEPGDYPTGGDWVDAYLRPLAEVLGDGVRLGHRVTAVTRLGRDVLVDAGRGDSPFVVHVDGPDGPARILARAVVDASGTWGRPNPLGSEGVPATGELEHADRITHRIPDLTAADERRRYAGRHVVVAGTGASAKTALVRLTQLAADAPDTRVTWLVRRSSADQAFGGEQADELERRGALGTDARRAVEDGPVRTVTGFHTVAVEPGPGGTLTIRSADGRQVDDVDEVIALTGFRPDTTILAEVRTDLDPVLQAPRRLAPMIDPNVHSCGTVEPHGVDVLTHPEEGLFVVGMKSYGRAPSFLALTGFEQARSVVAHLAGDHEAAARVELTLPESGVCGGAGDFAEAGGGCCGAPAEPELLGIGRL